MLNKDNIFDIIVLLRSVLSSLRRWIMLPLVPSRFSPIMWSSKFKMEEVSVKADKK